MPHANLGRLTSQDLWMNAVLVVAGLALPEVLRRMVEGNGTDLPNEVYGVGVAVASYMVASGSTAKGLAGGASAYTVLKLGERFDLIEPVAVRFKSGSLSG